MRRLERIVAEETFVELASQALQRRHPNADWLVEHGRLYRTGLTDRALAAANERLAAWLENHQTPDEGQG